MKKTNIEDAKSFDLSIKMKTSFIYVISISYVMGVMARRDFIEVLQKKKNISLSVVL